MSDVGVPVAGEAPTKLSEWQRVINTFTAPSKTFEDIKGGNRSWWMPFLIIVLTSYILFAAITLKVGWAQVADNVIRNDSKAAERMEKVPAEQKASTMKITQYTMEGSFAASPIFVLAAFAVCSLVLWGTINFGFGGKATFGSVFAVWMFASLPGIFKALLGAIVVYSGAAPESFNLNNFAPTSVGAFLTQQDTNAALYKLASALDITTIWTMVLVGIGVATVAGVKRSSGYVAIFAWWAIVLLVGVGWAAAFS
jgi:cell division protein FtsB